MSGLRGGKRRYVRFTRWRRARFFRVLGETGHVQMAAEAAGVSHHSIYRLRRVEAGFAARMDAAREEAARRLASSPGSAAAQGERVEEGAEGDSHFAPSPCRRFAPAVPLPETGEGVGWGEGLFVVRRGIGGRLRVVAAGRSWTMRTTPSSWDICDRRGTSGRRPGRRGSRRRAPTTGARGCRASPGRGSAS